MEIIKEHPIDEMKYVVKNYRGCGHIEYWGMIHWRDGLQYCRKCIYKKWSDESHWKPGKEDYVFPYYEDGINYYKGDEENGNVKTNDEG